MRNHTAKPTGSGTARYGLGRHYQAGHLNPYTDFMTTVITGSAERRKRPGRLAFWLGLLFAVLGPVLYTAQLRAGRLVVPWYLPVFGTLGLLFMLAAVGRARSVGRIVLVGLLGFLAFGEWFFLLSLSKLPTYSGPVAVGKPFPVFATVRADGSPFTQASLPGDANTIMVFFRGEW